MLKSAIRQLLVNLQLPLTRNLKYDILTKKILHRELHSDSHCIDVGAHKGEILDLLLAFAPNGKHTAFEPIPQLYSSLQKNYLPRVSVYPFALSNRTGSMLFNVVVDDPAYSGLQRRSYKSNNPIIEAIEVDVRMLDDVMKDCGHKIHLIKIDVEGGELDVLKGASRILAADKPLLIFEFGKGASEYYGTMPHHMHELLQAHGYELRTLDDYWKNRAALNAEELKSVYDNGSDYYFVANASSNR
ncbi:MAG: FkbM family methyltransferase [Flavobacteriales bacterium]